MPAAVVPLEWIVKLSLACTSTMKHILPAARQGLMLKRMLSAPGPVAASQKPGPSAFTPPAVPQVLEPLVVIEGVGIATMETAAVFEVETPRPAPVAVAALLTVPLAPPRVLTSTLMVVEAPAASAPMLQVAACALGWAPQPRGQKPHHPQQHTSLAHGLSPRQCLLLRRLPSYAARPLRATWVVAATRRSDQDERSPAPAAVVVAHARQQHGAPMPV